MPAKNNTDKRLEKAVNVFTKRMQEIGKLQEKLFADMREVLKKNKKTNGKKM